VTSTYRPPRQCPVCTDRLHVTQLGCPTCGTGLSGNFEPCEFCGLEDTDRAMLRVFLASRGNMKEVERHLGVSYPTARARFDDMLGRLGLADEPAAAEPDPRLATLEALAAGAVDVDTARARLEADAAPAPTPTAKPGRKKR
jgi:hypothetical protein